VRWTAADRRRDAVVVSVDDDDSAGVADVLALSPGGAVLWRASETSDRPRALDEAVHLVAVRRRPPDRRSAAHRERSLPVAPFVVDRASTSTQRRLWVATSWKCRSVPSPVTRCSSKRWLLAEVLHATWTMGAPLAVLPSRTWRHRPDARLRTT